MKHSNEPNQAKVVHISTASHLLSMANLIFIVLNCITNNKETLANWMLICTMLVLLLLIEHMPRIIIHEDKDANMMIGIGGPVLSKNDIVTILVSIIAIIICATKRLESLLVVKQCIGISCVMIFWGLMLNVLLGFVIGAYKYLKHRKD